MSSGRLYGLLFLCTLLSILTAGIWPLDFFPRNNAVVLPELKGLRFNGPHSAQKTATGGVAFTPQPLVWPPSAAEEGRDLTIEIAVKPDAEPGGSRYVMLGLFDQKSRAQVYLSQWQSFLLVRTLQEDPDIYREIDALERVARPMPPRIRLAPQPEPFLALAGLCLLVEIGGARVLRRRIP